MSENHSTSPLNRRRFLEVAGTVTAVSAMCTSTSRLVEALPSPPVAVDYPITIDLLDDNKLAYTINGQNANPLTVDEGKTVTWKVNPQGKHYRVTILFKNRKTPLADSNGNLLNAVHGSHQDEGTLKVGGKIAGGTKGHRYRYAVAVFDDDNTKTYSDDPKIIVGGGVDEAIEDLQMAVEDVKEAEQALTKRPAQLEKAESIESSLNKLILELRGSEKVSK